MLMAEFKIAIHDDEADDDVEKLKNWLNQPSWTKSKNFSTEEEHELVARVQYT